MPALKPYLEKIFFGWNLANRTVKLVKVKIMWISVLCAIATNSQFLYTTSGYKD